MGLSRPNSETQSKGRRGERQCEKYLKKKGCRLITRNYRCRGGEIDLVISDGLTVVFVEVKSRTDEDFSPAEDAITYPKKKRLTYAARQFISEYNLYEKPLRFDVVIILSGGKIRHYKNAFKPVL